MSNDKVQRNEDGAILHPEVLINFHDHREWRLGHAVVSFAVNGEYYDQVMRLEAGQRMALCFDGVHTRVDGARVVALFSNYPAPPNEEDEVGFLDGGEREVIAYAQKKLGQLYFSCQVKSTSRVSSLGRLDCKVFFLLPEACDPEYRAVTTTLLRSIFAQRNLLHIAHIPVTKLEHDVSNDEYENDGVFCEERLDRFELKFDRNPPNQEQLDSVNAMLRKKLGHYHELMKEADARAAKKKEKKSAAKRKKCNRSCSAGKENDVSGVAGK